jgi:hypothetical protein
VPIRPPSPLAAILLGMGDVIHFPVGRRAVKVVEAELARAREKSERQSAAALEVRERRRREAAARDAAGGARAHSRAPSSKQSPAVGRAAAQDRFARMAVAPRAVRVVEPLERSAGREVETNPRVSCGGCRRGMWPK